MSHFKTYLRVLLFVVWYLKCRNVTLSSIIEITEMYLLISHNLICTEANDQSTQKALLFNISLSVLNKNKTKIWLNTQKKLSFGLSIQFN